MANLSFTDQASVDRSDADLRAKFNKLDGQQLRIVRQAVKEHIEALDKELNKLTSRLSLSYDEEVWLRANTSLRNMESAILNAVSDK